MAIALAAVLLVPQAAHGFALSAPAGFGLAGFADYGKGFSWNKEILIAYDPSYVKAFGLDGQVRFESALFTWATSVSKPQPNDNQFDFTPVRNDFRGNSDLETVALHELGHALGLHHASQAFAAKKNYDNKGQLKNPANDIGKARYIMDLGEGLGPFRFARRQLTTDDIEGFQHLYQQDLRFNLSGVAAQRGAGLGADIDVFAIDFNADPQLKAFNQASALTDVKIDRAANNGPGRITGVDIFFNINVPRKVPDSSSTLMLLAIGLSLIGGFRRYAHF